MRNTELIASSSQKMNSVIRVAGEHRAQCTARVDQPGNLLFRVVNMQGEDDRRKAGEAEQIANSRLSLSARSRPAQLE